MFALAILDAQHRKLILARDCFGIKTLYYATGREGFAFASELKALLELNWVRFQSIRVVSLWCLQLSCIPAFNL
jgi:asparagine synthetase B (glutamine-hydrolysing)